ncbi:ArsR/SmtB family transcription factor [Algoriphagus pacificus]|uniref:Winged helix-turn-helix transcriptional regulator n=1 Tax=Algoriphagus pacificus TaxID=2811234 RepID=A0ABS3CGP6_9BACT|nr:metalloregulator ArsR/SmtB family transcription factor [Algoriphagus pacificus]MBN7816278.1 winged helix-turn-helix transcriptional regulator [Algoriphagus pacificus]
METRRDVFQAIADPTRRSILILISAGTLGAGAIAENFDSSRQTISKHIQILNECGLLVKEQKGREIYYHINSQNMKEIADFIEPFRELWEAKFQKMDKIIDNLKNTK